MVEEVKVDNTMPNLAGESEERDKRALEAVTESVERTRRARQEFETVWLVVDRIWRGDPFSRYFDVENSTHIPEPFKAEQAVTSQVLSALTSNKNWYRLVRGDKAAIDPVKAKVLLDEQFKDGKFHSNLELLVQMTAKYGTGLAKVPWTMDRRELVVSEATEEAVYDPASSEQTGVKYKRKTQRQTLNHDRSDLKVLSLFDFDWDWRYMDIQKSPFCSDEGKEFREYCLDMLETKQQDGSKVYQGLTREQVQALGALPAAKELAGRDLQARASGANQMKRVPENEIHRRDWWGLFDLEGNGERVECQIVVLDGTHVVRVAKRNLWHGDRPYLKTVWVPVEGQGYGLGVIEPIVHLCMDMNDNQNAINAGSALAVNPMVKKTDSANIVDTQFTIRPGRVLDCGQDINSIQEFRLTNTTGVGRENKEDLRREIEETSGGSRIFLPTSESTTGGTATKYSGQRRQANIRLAPMVRRFYREIMAPYLDMVLYNNQQFLDEKRVVLMTGRAGEAKKYEVTPEELAGIARIEPILPPQIELLGIRGQMMTGYIQTLATMGEMAFQEPFKTMLKMVWVNEFGEEDLEDVWPEEHEPESQIIENIQMFKGIPVKVDKNDNHLEHMAVGAETMGTPSFEKKPAKIKALHFAHFMNHRTWVDRLQQQIGPGPSEEQMYGAALEGEGMKMPPGEMPLEGVAQGRPLAEEQRTRIQGT